MTTIADIQKEYFGQLDHLDLELLLAHVLKKPREFVLTYPEYKIPKLKIENLKFKISRRMRAEPLAYILGHKEFFGLDFKVTPDTLIPRPETELLVEEALQDLLTTHYSLPTIIDIGTGSGNIIIALACSMKHETYNKPVFYASDISQEALLVARQNAKTHKVSGKIKFLHGNLLDPIIKKPTHYSLLTTHYSLLTTHLLILANLPYLSKEIYEATLPNVKKYEPRSALYSPKEGLEHYEKLLKQIRALQECSMLHATCYMEISPEQKTKLPKIIKKHLPQAKIEFHKDLAGKWRLCKIQL